MKYESELIKEIVDSRGHEKSSTHYQSECVEAWIDETKGAYPKLCDYQPEWLNYIVENPLGEFPYETVTDVTDATINNVVPYAYKSAILKGQTLVNLLNVKTVSGSKSKVLNMGLKSNTKYILIADVMNDNENQLNGKYVYNDGTMADDFSLVKKANNGKVTNVFTTPNNGKEIINMNVYFVDNVINKPMSVDNMVIIEYQDGIENWDIPYFEGMQSVKMPVLTTQGKNLWDNKVFEECPIATINNDGSITLNGTLQGNWLFNYTIDKGTYCASAIGNDNTSVHLFWKGFDGAFQQNYSFAISEKVTRQGYITRGTYDNVNIKLQLELGTQVTSYEPHKSNILSTPEDLELRGIGDVKDTLDLMTGEVVERIGEIVLDGSESWNEYTSQELTNTRLFYCGAPTNSNINTSKFTMINNRFASLDPNAGGLWNTDVVGLGYGVVKNVFRLRVLKSTANTINELKEYLHSNPIVVQYELAEKSIKTVDLTVIDQDGNTLSITKPFEGTMHIHSDGTPLKPSITMEIPVEATTQNLASFIKEE